MEKVNLIIREYVDEFEEELNCYDFRTNLLEVCQLAKLAILDGERVTWNSYLDDIRENCYIELPYRAAILLYMENSTWHIEIITADNHIVFTGTREKDIIDKLLSTDVSPDIEYDFMLYCLENAKISVNMPELLREFRKSSLRESLSEIFIM